MKRAPALVLLSLALPAGAAESVEVTNFPRSVGIYGPVTVDATEFHAFEDRVVPARTGPLPRAMVPLGIVDASGSASAILSLATWVPVADKGSVLGLLLVPDIPFAREAADRDGSTPFAIRLELPLGAAGALTVSSEVLQLAFPRWRAWLYTTGDAELRAHAFVMLRD